MKDDPEVTQRGAFSIQVCVPVGWTDTQIKSFADREVPCGTENGWFIRREGSESLGGYPERNPCDARHHYVHVMLDA